MATLLACVFIILGAALIWVGLSLMEANDKIDQLQADNTALQTRSDASDQRVIQTLIDVAPLLEKTDWMTGRWQGQFPTLVRLENERNLAVEKVRRLLMNAPALQDLWATQGTDLLKDIGTLAAREIAQ